jgi:hypothetical protein
MKKNKLNPILFSMLFIIFLFLSLPAVTAFAGGTGTSHRLASAAYTENSPYHNYFYRDRAGDVTSDGFCDGELEEAAKADERLDRSLKGPEPSACIKFDDVKGSGKYPYNFRVIDNKLFAGGNLFNPVTLKNTPERVKKYLMLLKIIGAKNIIALNVPVNQGRELKLIKEFCAGLDINFYACRMNSETVPDGEQTETIMRMIEEGAYIHCNWGCDRTGAVIAKYLVLRKGYSGEEAFNAVISKGSHSGSLGGLKQTPTYKKLVLYFWPEIAAQNPEAAGKYQIGRHASDANGNSPRNPIN